MRVTCRYHCGACGSHFSSLEAFDLHRVGPFEDRFCEEPADVRDSDGNARLVVKATDGRCVLSHGRVREGVTVYASARAPEWAGIAA